MSKVNIYQIKPDKISEMYAKFAQVGLVRQRSVLVDGFTLTFFFSEQPDEGKVWWVSTYKDFLENADSTAIKSRSYYAALVADRNGLYYAVSLGKSHFYIQKYCYFDFGINVGTRVLAEDGVLIKNARRFGGAKKKELSTYRGSSPLDIESGEAVEYLRGKTEDENIWGKRANFGISAQFSIKALIPPQIPTLLDRIETALRDNPHFSIPQTYEIKDKDEIRSLDVKLVDDILGNEGSVSLEEMTISGIDFIFLGDFQYTIIGITNDVPISHDMNIGELLESIRLAGYTFNVLSLNEIRIKAEADDGRGFAKGLKEILDYTDNDWHYLRDGKWFVFNENYKEGLVSQVDSLEIEGIEGTDYSETDFKTWLVTIPEEERSKWYAEKYFNEKVAYRQGFISFDRDMQSDSGYRIEYCDLLKDDCLYFVKIGTPQKLSYVLDQSIASLRLLVKNKGRVTLGGQEYKPKQYALWLILNRQRRISKLSEIRSIIFMQKVSDWMREVRNANLQPRVIVSYKV
jgi:uncharacterized protein (TIGR04141 family)